MEYPLKVKRDTIEVIIYTEHHRVEGEIHTPPAGRLSDFTNSRSDQSFIAVTNAKIYALSQEKPVHIVDFLIVNRNRVTMMFPKTSLK